MPIETHTEKTGLSKLFSNSRSLTSSASNSHFQNYAVEKRLFVPLWWLHTIIFDFTEKKPSFREILKKLTPLKCLVAIGCKVDRGEFFNLCAIWNTIIKDILKEKSKDSEIA